MSRETRKRQVRVLLSDYRAWHTAFGSAMATEDSHMKSASYGPAAFIEAGQQFPKKWRPALAVSYEKLDHALKMLWADGPVGRMCYITLLSPYLGDPADPGVVTIWRKRKPELAKWHDTAIEKLSGYLIGHDLFVIWPKRMTSQEAKQIEARNDELYGIYERLRNEGMGKSRAIEQAATMCGYGKTRAWEIVGIRESEEKAS